MTTTNEKPEASLDFIHEWIKRQPENLTCWKLVQEIYARRGVTLPDDYYSSLPLFSVTLNPQPWDVLAIRNHPFVTNHCGVYIGGGQFVHWMADTGVALAFIDRHPWGQRIAGCLRLKA